MGGGQNEFVGIKVGVDGWGCTIIDNITNNEIPKTFQYIHIFILKKEIKINF